MSEGLFSSGPWVGFYSDGPGDRHRTDRYRIGIGVHGACTDSSSYRALKIREIDISIVVLATEADQRSRLADGELLWFD